MRRHSAIARTMALSSQVKVLSRAFGQAVVRKWGEPPEYVKQDSLCAPTGNQVRIRVKAAGVHAVVRARAAGTHYSVKHQVPPHVPGVDGVGEIMQNGVQQMVYFTNIEGTLAEEVNVPKENVIPLPQGSDPIQVAALMNPASAAWMPLAGPAVKEHLPKEFTVLILGATSASGRLAISFARCLGAKHIIGVARNEDKLRGIKELDEVIVMQADPKKTDFSSLDNVDVIVDYVYGPLVEHLLEVLSSKSKSGCTYVNVGGLSGAKAISLSSDVLRCKRLRLVGAGKGSWSMEEWNAEAPKVLEALSKMSTANKDEAITVKLLEDVQQQWNATVADGRLVFEMSSRTCVE